MGLEVIGLRRWRHGEVSGLGRRSDGRECGKKMTGPFASGDKTRTRRGPARGTRITIPTQGIQLRKNFVGHFH